ncbi:hypothetical protein KI440_00895 [Candidatus Saccharibacteria bacterium TM7i]|nr:hypothetical protein KI440_00895 [Candidatus Saccharibacteria bacterium TM7i]
MFLVGLITWWYGRGWIEQWRRNGGMFMRTLEFFSVGQLAATLFSPFRQISAGNRGNGSFASAFSAFFDRLISRIVGAFVRGFTIIAGVIVIALQALYVAVIMAFWWFVPLLPLVGFVAFMIGWVPRG